jgi:ABC-type uncharacterized transport system ATPase subunit
MPKLPGVSVAEHSDSVLRVVVDTATRPIREVLDALLLDLEVTDISVADPPLEQVIAEIYARPRA